MGDNRGCREHKFAPGYIGYDKTNCGSCPSYVKEKCIDIVKVVQRYEDTPNFAEFNKMMRDSKSILIT